MNENDTDWDDEILYDFCNNRDRELIQQIPIQVRKREDTWYWLFENDGQFSVRSCYRQLHGESRSDYTAFWRKLWALKLPGKVG